MIQTSRPRTTHPIRRRWLVSALTVAMMVTASTGAVVGQSADDPLVESLLTAAELPDGFVSDGLVEGSGFNIDEAAFTEHDGVRVVSQVWRSPAGVLYDFRMAFDSAEAAAAYLLAASPVLSEVDPGGFEPGDDDVAGADEVMHYHAETPLNENATVIIDNYLLRVGPVTAKVLFGGVGFEDGTGLAMATEAAARMATIPAGADLRPPAGPSPSAGTSPATDDPTERLLRSVPAVIADACGALESSGTEVATVGCSPGGGFQVVYAAYASAADMDAGFDLMAARAGVLPRTGSCATGPHAGVNLVDGAAVGRVVCWVMNDVALIAATDERRYVSSLAIGTDGDLPLLWEWWLEVASATR